MIQGAGHGVRSAGHRAQGSGRANCTRPARQQGTVQDKAKVVSDGSPSSGGARGGFWLRTQVLQVMQVMQVMQVSYNEVFDCAKR